MTGGLRRLIVLSMIAVLAAIVVGACAVAADDRPLSAGPDPREIPLPPIATSQGTLPSVNELPVRKELPDVLANADGSNVTSATDWPQRRAEIKRVLEYYAVGQSPPPPGNVKGLEISSESLLDDTVEYRLIHLTFGPDEKLALNIGVFTPTDRDGPFPALIMPGGTPPGAEPLPTLAHPPGQGKGVDALLPVVSATEAAATQNAGRQAGARVPASADDIAARNRELFRRGYALVVFNNNDCAEDTTLRNDDGSWAFRTTRFYPAYPGYDWGILAGWAWGVSRIVDYLETDPTIDASKLIITGVSRTGKSAMVAAAFDDRIAMAAPCVTGGGGIGAYRFSGDGRGGKEGLDIMMKKYPNWFSPHLHEFWGQTDNLPFDNHWFLALVAPRPFLCLEGKTDGVSLANAVKQSVLGAKPTYALLNATDRLGINYADHGHTFNDEDLTAIMDFADKYLRGMPVERRFDQFYEPPDTTSEPQPITK
jgi:(4-O-methyl)-D-glucuronate---lignin esterase